jgi:hypothetical protein
MTVWKKAWLTIDDETIDQNLRAINGYPCEFGQGGNQEMDCNLE